MLFFANLTKEIGIILIHLYQTAIFVLAVNTFYFYLFIFKDFIYF